MKPSYFIFDLDDTLVQEIAFLKSAFKEIAMNLGDDALYHKLCKWHEQDCDVFEKLAFDYAINKEDLLKSYRTHFPTLILNEGGLTILNRIKSEGHLLGLITDGRSLTQRNKLKALGIESLFDQIIISEEFGSSKPDVKNYESFHQKELSGYYYIGDNITKDFITPNLLGWTTICLLDKGENIHQQNFELPNAHLPQYKINKLSELVIFI